MYPPPETKPISKENLSVENGFRLQWPNSDYDMVFMNKEK
jgi:hypothetical protein